MDERDKIINEYVGLIVDFLAGLYSDEEFIHEVRRLPKLTTPLPEPIRQDVVDRWIRDIKRL